MFEFTQEESKNRTLKTEKGLRLTGSKEWANMWAVIHREKRKTSRNLRERGAWCSKSGREMDRAQNLKVAQLGWSWVRPHLHAHWQWRENFDRSKEHIQGNTDKAYQKISQRKICTLEDIFKVLKENDHRARIPCPVINKNCEENDKPHMKIQIKDDSKTDLSRGIPCGLQLILSVPWIR